MVCNLSVAMCFFDRRAGCAAGRSSELPRTDRSEVIRIQSQVGEQQRFPSRLRAPALRLHSHKHGIESRECGGIIELQGPAFAVGRVLVEQPQGSRPERLSHYGPMPERHLRPSPTLLVEVIPIEDQGFVLGVEDPPKRLSGRSCLGHVVYFGDVEVARADQITDVAIMSKQLLILRQEMLLLLKSRIETLDSFLQRDHLGSPLRLFRIRFHFPILERLRFRLYRSEFFLERIPFARKSIQLVLLFLKLLHQIRRPCLRLGSCGHMLAEAFAKRCDLPVRALEFALQCDIRIELLRRSRLSAHNAAL